MKKLGEKLWDIINSTPVVGHLARFGRGVYRFPGRVREGLKSIPVVGPLVFRPYFALTAYLWKYPKFFFTHVMGPFVAAGALSAGLSINPDWTSEPLNDYLDKKGVDRSVLDGVDHKDIRIYQGNKLLAAFHLAGQKTVAASEVIHQSVGTGPTASALLAGAAYPFVLLSSFNAVATEYNAFTIPTVMDNSTCYIVDYESDAQEMTAAMAGLPVGVINFEKIGKVKWMSLMVALHEAKHCDNGKELIKSMIQASKDAMSGKDMTGSELNRTVLYGETDSDNYALDQLAAKYPDIAETIKYMRAVAPFTESMSGSTGHATSSGVDAHLRKLEMANTYDVADAIGLARQLAILARTLNSGQNLDEFNETVENYLVMKHVVIPYLEQQKDHTFPHERRRVRFSLVLDQARLFVEGMEYLVEPQFLARDFTMHIGIPDFAPSKPRQPAGP